MGNKQHLEQLVEQEFGYKCKVNEFVPGVFGSVTVEPDWIPENEIEKIHELAESVYGFIDWDDPRYVEEL